MDEKKKKIVVVATMLILIVVLLILSIVFMVGGLMNKPSKKTSEKLVKSYLEAINENDGSKATAIIDAEGYVILAEEGEVKFDKTYKKKKKYIEEYLDDNNYNDVEEFKDSLSDSFEDKHKYNSYKYTLEKILSIEKTEKSKKIYIIRAKVKKKNTYTSSTETMKFYVINVDGKFKIIGM